MNRPRVLFAGLFHETHTFLEGTTALHDFQVFRGADLLRCTGDSSPLGGALESAKAFGWEVVPTVDFRASPSAIVEDTVIEDFWRDLTARIPPQIDAVYLVLHGAMVSQSFPDVEGEILARLRQRVGEVPIFGVFDLHANFTQRMAELSSCLVAYRQNPHTDGRAAAKIAADLLQRSLKTQQFPRTYWQHPPLVWPPTGTGTADEPMRALEAVARQLESQNADFWTVNVIAGFAFADTPDTGVSFTVCTTGPETPVRAALQELCDLAAKLKDRGNVVDPPIEDALATLKTQPDGLTVLVEPSDNIGGGAPGDGTGLLRALIDHGVSNAAIAINDPDAVRQLTKRPVHKPITLDIGGKGSRLDAGPLPLEIGLLWTSDGKFELEDKQSHLASMAGDRFDMGPCAVVRHRDITILLTSRKTPPFDLGQWRSQGIDPAKLSVIVVKAAVAHRRAYDPIAARMIWVDTPGPCTSNLRSLPYRNIHRPIFPLDSHS
ncbi:MlrC domain protein [Chthoniobacter flavus Ellin428]|uniref:MlrC domain protein n=1 Tax=Chthoniobacter flavus Ellin428 TaxID=497964 RepID=B4CWN2_9BACT|nr:M81 family metallopeptidase [Chthoniobacter flavus]EDY21824.1 MlrC domain protein [Chthoniobacter flavus Ellin428]